MENYSGLLWSLIVAKYQLKLVIYIVPTGLIKYFFECSKFTT